MLTRGILNPAIRSLLSRVRHTNTLVIADRGFPFFREIEIVDIAPVDDIPGVLDVVRAIRSDAAFGRVFMAEGFRRENMLETVAAFDQALDGIERVFEPHVRLKKRVPAATGLIRTGDTIQYANMIFESR